MPSPSWRAIQGWLNQTATTGPLASATRASTRLRRRSRIGRTRHRPDRDRDGGLLPHHEVATGADVAAVAVRVRQVLEQVAVRLDARGVFKRLAGRAWERHRAPRARSGAG